MKIYLIRIGMLCAERNTTRYLTPCVKSYTVATDNTNGNIRGARATFVASWWHYALITCKLVIYIVVRQKYAQCTRQKYIQRPISRYKMLGG